MGVKTRQLSNTTGADINWQPIKYADGSTEFNIEAGDGYLLDTTGGVITVILPSSPNAGDKVGLQDYSGTFGTNNLYVKPSGEKVGGVELPEFRVTTSNKKLEFTYIDSSTGWAVTENSTQAQFTTADDPTFLVKYVTATGGTVTTSDDYKIHSFTGDGCFVVSCAGNAGGSNTVDYLVIAGGGGTGYDKKQGGGAGGYRESSGAASGCYTTSARNSCVSGLTLTVSTYPVTVGGGGGPGGSPYCTPSAGGSSSIFSTITSTGGGSGSPDPLTSTPLGSDGGSGGSYGAGNTPPTNPVQGFPGLNAPAGGTLNGGAGGAGAAATNGSGGAGVTSGITGSDVVRASGGGGGDDQPNPTPAATPGGGGKGGRRCGPCGTSGSANTGGGGGGSGANSPGFGGGSGLVVIRYKFQN